jgi:hypothetical protein
MPLPSCGSAGCLSKPPTVVVSATWVLVQWVSHWNFFSELSKTHWTFRQLSVKRVTFQWVSHWNFIEVWASETSVKFQWGFSETLKLHSFHQKFSKIYWNLYYVEQSSGARTHRGSRRQGHGPQATDYGSDRQKSAIVTLQLQSVYRLKSRVKTVSVRKLQWQNFSVYRIKFRVNTVSVRTLELQNFADHSLSIVCSTVCP